MLIHDAKIAIFLQMSTTTAQIFQFCNDFSTIQNSC